MLPEQAISNYYILRSKLLKKALDLDTYFKLFARNSKEIADQVPIVLMNLGDGFFETEVNLAMKVPNSTAVTITKFLHLLCKILEIERTNASQQQGKWILLVHKANHAHAVDELKKLLENIL